MGPCGSVSRRRKTTNDNDECADRIDVNDSTKQQQAKTFGECCGLLLLGGEEEEEEDNHCCLTPRDVLQSRYTAFCYRDVKHIIQTTHPQCRDYQKDQIKWAQELDANGMFDSFDFIQLQITDDEDTSEDNNKEATNEAYLEFTVRLRARSMEKPSLLNRLSQSDSITTSIKGEETVVKEKSKFIKDDTTGVWKYAGGDVRSDVKGLEDTTLNGAYTHSE